MDLDALMRAAREWLSEHEPGQVPDALVLRLRGGRELGFSFPTVSPPVEDNLDLAAAEIREDDADDPPVVAAIFRALYASDQRLTGDQILDKLLATHRGEKGFGEKNVSNWLTRLVKDGRLVSFPKDPRDGLGRGYALPESRMPPEQE